MPTYREMAELIVQTPANGVDQNFKADEVVSLSAAVAKTNKSKGKWKGIKIELYNFIIGVEQGGSGSLGNDDPQFIGLCMCPSPQVSASVEEVDLPEHIMKYVGRKFGTYGPLNSDTPVRFGLVTSAFNNDSSEAWEGIVKALGGDLSNALQAALTVGGTAVPGLSAYSTPGAVASALASLVKDALTDEPVPMSGDVIIYDTINAIDWWRNVDQPTWTARKFQVYREPNGPGWYMTQWFITLDSRVQPYGYQTASAARASLGVRHAMARPRHAIATDIAALRVLGGERIGLVAEAMNISPVELGLAVESLANEHEALAAGRVLAALALHAKALPDKGPDFEV
jgi:hypothetical protein